MFHKFGSAITAEKTTLSDWRRMIVSASIKQDPQRIETLAEFDLDKENFVYVRTRAVSAYEMHGPNQNGDAFEFAELEKSYRTFVRRGAYINHESDSPEKAIGIILDASWHPKEGFVQTLIAIDRNEPIARKIESGIANKWSMGAVVAHCVCSEPACSKVCTSEADYCEHLANYMGKEYNGRKIFAYNRNVNFYEESNVTIPADAMAETLQVFANKQDTEKLQRYTVLAHKYTEQLEAMVKDAKATNSADEIVNDVRGKLNQPARPATEGKILGKVRRTLKAAKAPLLPPESEAVRRRVHAALAAGDASAEQQKKANEEIPLEGLKVENQLTVRYIPGDSLAECFFIARKGNLQASVKASDILDPQVQNKIVAMEKSNGQTKKAFESTMKDDTPNEGKIKDESKPSADNTLEEGKEATQPKDLVNDLSAKPGKEIKDDSKPGHDNVMENGKDPAQPSDVVKKYAQLIGAKSVTFKKGENGSFTAYLSGASIARLAALWNQAPRLIKSAKVAGEPMAFAREDQKLSHTDMRSKPTIAREDKSKEMAKPSGGSGAEIKSYFNQLDSKNLANGGEEGWARKAAELTKKAEALEKESIALKAENEVLKKTLQAHKMAVETEKKAGLIGKLVEVFEKVGSIREDQDEVFTLVERGLGHEDARVKAYDNAKERKVAELKSLSVEALNTMLSNLSDIAPAVKTASKKNLEIPMPGREDRPSSDEDFLASNW